MSRIVAPRTLASAAFAVLLAALGGTACARAEASSTPGPTVEWSGERWWLAYDDPQLHDLIERGLKASPRIAGAAARSREAAAAFRAARGTGRPALVLHGGLTRLDAGDGRLGDLLPTRGGGVGLASTYELDLRGRVRAETAAARGDSRAARADWADTALQVSTGIARVYGELAALYDVRDLERQESQVREQLMVVARQWVQEGGAPASDAELAAAALARGAAELAATEEAIARARIELAVLVGIEPDRMAPLERPRGVAVDAPMFGEIGSGGPRLAAAKARADAAGRRVDAERAAYFPSLRFLALTGTQGVGGATALLSGEGVGALAAALQLPILDGGRRRAAVRAAEAARDAAAARYEEVRLGLTGDAAAIMAARRSLSVQLEHVQAAAAASAADSAGQRRRFEVGDVAFASVLQAEARSLADRRAVLELEARRFRLEIDQVEVSGGGWREVGAER